MVTPRTCKFRKEGNAPCRAAPRRDSEYCIWHDPDLAEEMSEARRLGGLRRRRERTVSVAYDFAGLGTIPEIRRLIEVAAMDVLGLENSIARGRTLAYLASVAAMLVEKGELEGRLADLETALGPRLEPASTRSRRNTAW